MIVIHPVHRRLAELQAKVQKLGGYRYLSASEQLEIHHCFRENLNLIRKIDELKNLAFIAHYAGDTEWEQEICAELDELEARLI